MCRVTPKEDGVPKISACLRGAKGALKVGTPCSKSVTGCKALTQKKLVP